MRLLFDNNLSRRLVQRLADVFPKVVWLRIGNATTDYVERVLREHRVDISEFAEDPTKGVLVIDPA